MLHCCNKMVWFHAVSVSRAIWLTVQPHLHVNHSTASLDFKKTDHGSFAKLHFKERQNKKTPTHLNVFAFLPLSLKTIWCVCFVCTIDQHIVVSFSDAQSFPQTEKRIILFLFILSDIHIMGEILLPLYQKSAWLTADFLFILQSFSPHRPILIFLCLRWVVAHAGCWVMKS